MASRKPTPLPRSDYRALLRDVKKLAQTGEDRASAGKIESQWAIGQRIQKLKLSREAGYHNSVIRDLSADSGLAISTLHQSVQFFDAFEKAPSDEGLTWAHYRTLLRVPEKSDRQQYVARIQKEGWTSRQLEAAITRGLHDGPKGQRLAITRPERSDYIYSARVLDIVDGDTLDVSIDLGFGVKRELRTRLAQIDCPPLETQKGRSARDFVAAEMMTARTVAVQTHKSDKYGRFVVHLFFAGQELSAIDCFEKGHHLNERLLRKKHAVVIG